MSSYEDMELCLYMSGNGESTVLRERQERRNSANL